MFLDVSNLTLLGVRIQSVKFMFSSVIWFLHCGKGFAVIVLYEAPVLCTWISWVSSLGVSVWAFRFR